MDKKYEAKNKYLIRKYGIDIWTYWDMYEAQLGQCGICKQQKDVLCVDHRHIKGFKKLKKEDKAKEVRGLLCIYCNRLLGRVEHSKQCRLILKNINRYFEEFKMKGDL